jgi:hypothetical protein
MIVIPRSESLLLERFACHQPLESRWYVIPQFLAFEESWGTRESLLLRQHGLTISHAEFGL